MLTTESKIFSISDVSARLRLSMTPFMNLSQVCTVSVCGGSHGQQSIFELVSLSVCPGIVDDHHVTEFTAFVYLMGAVICKGSH